MSFDPNNLVIQNAFYGPGGTTTQYGGTNQHFTTTALKFNAILARPLPSFENPVDVHVNEKATQILQSKDSQPTGWGVLVQANAHPPLTDVNVFCVVTEEEINKSLSKKDRDKLIKYALSSSGIVELIYKTDGKTLDSIVARGEQLRPFRDIKWSAVGLCKIKDDNVPKISQEWNSKIPHLSNYQVFGQPGASIISADEHTYGKILNAYKITHGIPALAERSVSPAAARSTSPSPKDSPPSKKGFIGKIEGAISKFLLPPSSK